MKVAIAFLLLTALAGPVIAGDHAGSPVSPLSDLGTEPSWLMAAPCAERGRLASGSLGFTFAPQASGLLRSAPPVSLRLAAQAVSGWQEGAGARAGEFRPDDDPSESTGLSTETPSITWGPLLSQSLLYSVVQHSFRLGFEDGPWEELLEGPFWEDYFNSVKTLCCWDDGDRNTTNYLFHPLLGSAAAMVFANNHRASKLTAPGEKGYWNAKWKQGLYALAYSTYFELGLVLSETAIGNVGLDPGEQTYLDLVVTPLFGTFVSAGEDYMRLHLIEPVNRKNHFWGATLAIFLNPARSFSNLLAFKTPWDDPVWLKLRREQYGR